MTDPVRIQVGIKLDKNIPVTYDFLRSVVATWADGDKLPRGIHIVYIRWINNVRRNLSLAVWKDSRDKGQSLQGARSTLRGLLRTIQLEFFNTPKKQERPPTIQKKRPKKTVRKQKPKTARKAKKRSSGSASRKLQHVRQGKGVRKTK